jgi:DNA-damage-inducible protein D
VENFLFFGMKDRRLPWRNFLKTVTKAKTACEVSGHQTTDHFVDVNKMVDLGSGSQRQIDDIMLTRFQVPH